jgi:hypothetical protein
VSRRVRRHHQPSAADLAEIHRALDALSAPELRTAVCAILDDLDEDVRASAVERLITRASKAAAGWKPARLDPRLVADAQVFAEAARRIGHADPIEVTEHLRLATKAFLAGDHASARAVFEAILPPIASVDIDLGQHELVEEVLGVDAHMCVAQYVASVYTTTPLRDRVDAVLRTIETAQEVGTLSSPIKDMEDVFGGMLPELEAFLPLWVKRIERFGAPKGDWESDHERWLREAKFRLDGVSGLERLARKTRRPHACLAWYTALAARGDWPAALRAAVASAGLVRQSHWRAELLDGAALAAQELGRTDLPKRLECAWRTAPTLPRLLRWLAAGEPSRDAIRVRAAKSAARCPKGATRQFALLRVVLDDVPGAAAILATAPGLGWSDPNHPGHMLFPVLAGLLSKGNVDKALLAELEATGDDRLELFTEGRTKPRLTTPSVMGLVQRARPATALTDAHGDAALDAMRVAAEKRVQGSSNTHDAGTTATPGCSSPRASRMRRRDAGPNSHSGRCVCVSSTAGATPSGANWRERVRASACPCRREPSPACYSASSCES